MKKPEDLDKEGSDDSEDSFYVGTYRRLHGGFLHEWRVSVDIDTVTPDHLRSCADRMLQFAEWLESGEK